MDSLLGIQSEKSVVNDFERKKEKRKRDRRRN